MNEQALILMAQQNRIKILDMVYEAQSGHIGGSFSAIDIVTYLFSERIDCKVEPRDRFILSKGHSVPAVYAMLHTLGYVKDEEMHTFRKLNSRLQGHTNVLYMPLTDVTTGLLGQGLSYGVGMALGKRVRHDPHNVYVMTGDGELHEGQNWEAIMEAAHYHLDNLVWIVDHNMLCSHQLVEKTMNIEPLPGKISAFGWHVTEIDGHNFKQIEHAFTEADGVTGMPKCIIAHTKKGNGVSFMTGNGKWHRNTPNDEEYKAAMVELQASLAALNG